MPDEAKPVGPVPSPEELASLFMAAKGTVCKDCPLFGDGCCYHDKNPQAFICAVDAVKLSTDVLKMFGRPSEPKAPAP